MNIGILQCDKVREKFSPEHGQYPQMFAALFKQVDPNVTFTTFDVEQMNLPANIEVCDAYLITGSRHGVNDDLPWIPMLEAFICKLHRAEKKTIGICFGHQLIAKALGGKVGKSLHGWGVGMSKNTIHQQRPWMNPTCESFNLLMSHQDQVTELPTDAEVLASNDLCPIYMMQIGNNLTIQGHPEFTKHYMKALIEDRKNILDPTCYQRGLDTLQLNKDDMLIAQWMMRFLNG